ncbi:MAG: hypothetical protein AMXMBFR58_22720 [Phycisphaerae bacterium]|nr:Thiol-disulfide oxidoreductase ResA [Phycisphaerales bacterium]MCK6477836.1 TlpA family protein disulfide reductase [Phycisphaerales bacterium]
MPALKSRSIVLASAVLLASAGLVVAQPAADKPAEKPAQKEREITLKVGDKAPAIKVDKWIKGEQVTGFEKGRTYVVEFWATWCGPCRASIPHLTELQKQHKDVTVIGVTGSERKPASGPDNRLENLEKFVKDQGEKMDYRVAYDSDREMVKEWMDASGQAGIPTAFIVDGEGKIAWIGHPLKMDEPLKQIASGKPVTDDGKKDQKKDGKKK